MASRINADTRQLVAERANLLCEYCLIGEIDSFYGCQVDHVISRKHGGSSDAFNLAFACALCNRAKGSDIGSVATGGEFVRFFNPRIELWSEHFWLDQAMIKPKTPIGEVTVLILGFNTSARVHEREIMLQFGTYPGTAARELMSR
jgi:hypothetical protein